MRLTSSLRIALTAPLLLVLAGFAPRVHAGEPYLDKGAQPDVNDLYTNVQKIPNSVFQDRAIYGKLEGDTPVDIYSFTPDKDGDQSVSLLIRKDEVATTTNPYLVLVDPTASTEAQELGIPLPSEGGYHAAILKQVALSDAKLYNEPVLMEQYTVAADQRLTLSKDKMYYLIVLDSDTSGKHFTHYGVRFGDATAWSFKDFFKHMGAWLKIKSDTYGATTPFNFGPGAIGFFLLVVGLILTLGVWVLFQIFNLGSTRSKTAGYLLVKLQPYTKIITWVGLWFTALGGYMYFSRHSWAGLPFLVALTFVPFLIVSLVDTLVLAPQVQQVEVSRKEAALPLPLRKKLFVTFVLGLIFGVALLVLVTMQVMLGK